MPSETEAAPKEWRGRFYEDFAVGDVYRSRFGRTVTRESFEHEGRITDLITSTSGTRRARGSSSRS